MTLDELMKDRRPGEIKVRCEEWAPKNWFQPFYVTETAWHGRCQNNESYAYTRDEDGWELWVEPKKRVKRWLLAERIDPKGPWHCSTRFYSDDELESFRIQLGPNMIKTDVTIETEE
jgi:hypothetical protein